MKTVSRFMFKILVMLGILLLSVWMTATVAHATGDDILGLVFGGLTMVSLVAGAVLGAMFGKRISAGYTPAMQPISDEAYYEECQNCQA